MSAFQPGHDYDIQTVRHRLRAAHGDPPLIAGGDEFALVIEAGVTDGPSFPERSVVHWPGELPKRFVESKAKPLVFIDAGQGRLRFVGHGRLESYSSSKAAPHDVRFHVTPPLARSDWLALIANALPPLEPAPEAALVALGPDSTADDRWRALQMTVRSRGSRSPSACPGF